MAGPFTFPVALAVPYDNSDSGLIAENTKEAIDEVNEKVNSAIFTIPLIYNGTLSGNIFVSYSNLTPNSPIVIPINCEFVGFTFSNAISGADFTLAFRKNVTTGTPFYSVTRNNTLFFADNNPSEFFTAGETITVNYIDNGTNGNDACIILAFRGVPT